MVGKTVWSSAEKRFENAMVLAVKTAPIETINQQSTINISAIQQFKFSETHLQCDEC